MNTAELSAFVDALLELKRRGIYDGYISFAFDAGKWVCLKIDIGANYLTRELGVHIGSLPTAQDVADCLQITPYDSAPWDTTSNPSFRNQLEGWIGPNIHNRVHEWVGGHMRPLSSPNDPVFWLHHANIDRLWAQWQYEHSDLTYMPQHGARHRGRTSPTPWIPGSGTPPSPAHSTTRPSATYTTRNGPRPKATACCPVTCSWPTSTWSPRTAPTRSRTRRTGIWCCIGTTVLRPVRRPREHLPSGQHTRRPRSAARTPLASFWKPPPNRTPMRADSDLLPFCLPCPHEIEDCPGTVPGH
ncbi:putative monophenol monooxygenase [Streptomyces avermitilis MA-4680 = NBRC 14893]|uniref:Monophenol monooxygenase n=1 Tax=Streptomyces avermitilis (strain ATCC 31267 / DSM 46492 / JCM 5070 / NBRC 14893 / NCIMB 12804 / NRRL 8165 / MA-4680) TaxID=227882 RepID=Q825U2_STRAW|nr:putative monophenol monooxygenase [Streptomyces avermitilis MA-4680 = NBRC 14893]